ncbi:MAG: hypothetical protein Q7T55_10240, partial [Solirubrobacteraceae bacterium]|nr:hypothetical protein [Solirubrobacteraceae bacterium]
MPNVPARHPSTTAAGRRSRVTSGRRTDAGFLAGLVVLVALVAGLSFTSGTPDASAQTTPQSINSIVVRMTGQMTLTFDKAFLKTIKRSGASVKVKSGAKYSSKKRTATLPVDSTVAVTFDPADADILAKGTVSFRRKDKRNVTVQDISLRIRAAGADVGGTVRGRPSREFAALTLSPTTNVAQTQN